MDLTAALDLGREALLAVLIISGPVLAAGLLVGLVISVLQTVTQLHDQTLSIVPKIVAMVAAAMFFIPWLAHRVIEYTQGLLSGQ